MKGNFQVYMSVPLKHIKTSLLIKRVVKRDITTTVYFLFFKQCCMSSEPSITFSKHITTTVTTYIHATTYIHG